MNMLDQAIQDAIPALAAAAAPVLVAGLKAGARALGARLPDWAKVALNVAGGIVLAQIAASVAGGSLTGDPTTDGALGALAANKLRDLRAGTT